MSKFKFFMKNEVLYLEVIKFSICLGMPLFCYYLVNNRDIMEWMILQKQYVKFRPENNKPINIMMKSSDDIGWKKNLDEIQNQNNIPKNL